MAVARPDWTSTAHSCSWGGDPLNSQDHARPRATLLFHVQEHGDILVQTLTALPPKCRQKHAASAGGELPQTLQCSKLVLDACTWRPPPAHRHCVRQCTPRPPKSQAPGHALIRTAARLTTSMQELCKCKEDPCSSRILRRHLLLTAPAATNTSHRTATHPQTLRWLACGYRTPTRQR